jgi:hypothetical protein
MKVFSVREEQNRHRLLMLVVATVWFLAVLAWMKLGSSEFFHQFGQAKSGQDRSHLRVCLVPSDIYARMALAARHWEVSGHREVETRHGTTIRKPPDVSLTLITLKFRLLSIRVIRNYSKMSVMGMFRQTSSQLGWVDALFPTFRSRSWPTERETIQAGAAPPRSSLRPLKRLPVRTAGIQSRRTSN